ncbi:glycosyltransferase [Kordiimonas gwangyangensis]|uniref:glycosyltransferase n=1 Tax=Kordiimonas gwangyangensis TaxID=288022 RepID=UPI000375B0AA|nr:glycosyltransferase [Kordiimonas gwangyangensis]
MVETKLLTAEERERALTYFDPAWYGRTYEFDGLDTKALETHFLEEGVWEGKNPGPLFSGTVYTESNRHAFDHVGLPPLVHYVRHGCHERRKPNPLFNPHVYAYFLDAAESIADLFAHFLDSVKRGASPTFSTIVPAGFAADAEGIDHAEAYTRLFDPEASLVGLLPRCVFRPNFYRRIARERRWANELFDYQLGGWRKGYDPHPLFDSSFYLEMLEKSETLDHCSLENMSPLEHYAEHWAEAPNPSPFFDSSYYNHVANLPETDYRNPLEAFCAMDPRFKRVSPHRKVNFAALGHSVQDGLVGDGKPFEAGSLVALLSSLRLEGMHRKAPVAASADPELSILVLNYKNLEHTILSVYLAARDAEDIAHEILVLDNGSGNWDLHQLKRYLDRIPHVRVIGSERNTYFGEGNNLLIDEARGKYLMFLNNDAYLGKGTLAALKKVLDEDTSCGMTGPTFLFPNGVIQEQGGRAEDSGETAQLLKHLPYDQFIAQRAQSVPSKVCDYVSAAGAMTRAALIREIGGFDLIFEPFFFEDTDLCRRVRASGHSVRVCTDAVTVHLENTSTRDFLGDGFSSQVMENRRKYASRWFDRDEASPPPRASSNIDRFLPRDSGKPRALIYTPFALSLGGGERYILSVAAALSTDYDVIFATPCATSRTRLAFVMDDLGVAGDFTLTHWDRVDLRQDYDLFVAMGNEIAPTVKPVGKRNIYHCQFPFPLHRVEGRSIENLNGFDEIVVNSAFTKTHTEAQLGAYGFAHIPVHVITPPVKVNTDKGAALYHTDELTLATLGRFITREHMKRQDVVLEALCKLEGRKGTIEKAYIAGGLSSDSDDVAYFEDLKAKAPRFVSVEANVARHRLEAILKRASLYMHATGFGISPAAHPHYMEHFGITIIEAMSYGCVPLVFDGGGPAEIIRDCGVGYTFTTVPEAIDRIIAFSALPEAERQTLAVKAFEAAQRYNEAAFATAWRERVKAK